ncbi:MAG: lysine--tRNA ligase [Candidatus Pacearchaeota archaeon]
MGREELIIEERIKKIKEIRASGVNPYPNKFDRTHLAKEIIDKNVSLKNGSKTSQKVKVAGRVMSIRDFGKIAFAVIQDDSAKLQITLQKDETPEKTRTMFTKWIDVGDFIGVDGTVIRTERGELSVLAKNLELLTKSVLPLPEKYHGLKDDEERLRKRYLDILTDPETKEMFIRKSKFWNTMRAILLEKGFVEVETPVLETSAGGAAATPFKTHHNALDLDVYLRISMGELWQKRLMVAGFDRTFEIGRQFRNEGMDAEHLQDYTQMEFYWGYANYEDGMNLVEEMYKKIAKEVYGKTKFTIGDHTFDLAKTWKKIDYASTVKKETGIDIFIASIKEMESKLKELNGVVDPGQSKQNLVDSLWKYCRKKISGPAFLVGHPVEVSPLAKRDPKDARKVERFQVLLGGSEVGNGYSELNDPLDQEERFVEQQKMKDAGDMEAQDHDKDFVEALKHGMPPTCGFGVSERLFSFFEGKPMRETVIFPLMRPETTKTNAEIKSKETKIAVALLNKDSNLKGWEQMNTIAHLNASFAGRIGRQLFIQDLIETQDSQKLKLNIQHAIMIKSADTKSLQKLLAQASEKSIDSFVFTREMLETTDDKKVIERTRQKKNTDIEYLGVLVFGNKKEVESITKEFKLVD